MMSAVLRVGLPPMPAVLLLVCGPVHGRATVESATQFSELERLLDEGRVGLADIEKLLGTFVQGGATADELEDTVLLARAVRHLVSSNTTSEAPWPPPAPPAAPSPPVLPPAPMQPGATLVTTADELREQLVGVGSSGSTSVDEAFGEWPPSSPSPLPPSPLPIPPPTPPTPPPSPLPMPPPSPSLPAPPSPPPVPSVPPPPALPPLGAAPFAFWLTPGAILELGGEEIVVSGANVTISSDGEGATIDAQQLSRCFILEGGARLELSKIHLRNGFADSSNGGAICVRPGCALRLFSCSVADCEATGDGAADDSYADEAYLADSVTGGGGAVYGFGASVDIHATTVSGCFAASFGAFCSGGVGSTLVLHASVITDCHTTVGDAGALAVTAAGLCLISGCNITCCSAATLCGGFLAVETARLVLSGCAVVEMSASAAAHGGCRDATVVVTHCVFSDGSAYRCLAAGAQHAHASACTLAPSQSHPPFPPALAASRAWQSPPTGLDRGSP